jgi:hypothetical protein
MDLVVSAYWRLRGHAAPGGAAPRALPGHAANRARERSAVLPPSCAVSAVRPSISP